MSLVFGFSESFAKDVVIPYDEFIKMMSGVDHSNRVRQQVMEQNRVLVKLKDEHQKVIELSKAQLEQCEHIVKDHEKMGEAQDQIIRALEQEVLGEKRLGRYKTEFIAVSFLIGGLLWLLN